MIKKYWFELTIIVMFILSVGILVGATIYSDDIKHLKNQVVEAYDKGYSDGENDALFDLMEDYYDFYLLVVVSREKSMNDWIWTYGLQMLDNNSDIAYVDSDKLFSIGEYVLAVEVNENSVILIDLMENAVLKNQPSNEKYIEQILDDFELLFELQQHYYRENITSHSFGDWLQINYPALYERILNYY